jgi:hypothetical protein
LSERDAAEFVFSDRQVQDDDVWSVGTILTVAVRDISRLIDFSNAGIFQKLATALSYDRMIVNY